ncbi:hypothetical protein JRQ81_009952 [Phrynocephalus forsythii]|uniref:Uncharacterized protein n=1 Tax=Phrynocephalus forsythii TaxID=171643 RepID=A0A9Q1B7K8_9SAUR|nr:hypothetical protein JRQ81_009952 [Phrynocephalus forsythii]
MSSSGFLFMYGGRPISRASHKQNFVALSFTDSKLIAASEACRERQWPEKLLKDVEINEKMPIQMLDVKRSFIKLFQIEKMNACTKHIDMSCVTRPRKALSR